LETLILHGTPSETGRARYTIARAGAATLGARAAGNRQESTT
jgi:hypothetical protein